MYATIAALLEVVDLSRFNRPVPVISMSKPRCHCTKLGKGRPASEISSRIWSDDKKSPSALIRGAENRTNRD